MDEDKYSKLIELVDKFNEDTDGSMTHVNRSKRVIKEIAEINNRFAILLVKNMMFIPTNDFVELKECAITMMDSMEEFADFLKDYGEDLVKLGKHIHSMR